jgi:predicted dehydrogenase
MAIDTVRAGLVGCGYWGSKHLRVLNELQGCDLRALCEPSAANLERQPRAFLPPFVTPDYDRFLEQDIQAVVIATPARTHFDLARRALLAGKHVLVEKPFTTTSRDAAELIALAQGRGLRLAVGHTYVYHPAVQRLREIIESGVLGDILYIHTERLNFGLLQPDVDVLWDLAPHDISILLYVLQKQPLVSTARGAACLGPSLCEVAHIDLEFMGGVVAHVHLSWLEPTKVRRMTVVGSDRTVVYDDMNTSEPIRIFDKSIKLIPGGDENHYLSPRYLDGEISSPRVDGSEPLKIQCASFLNAIRTGESLPSTGRDGLKVVKVLEAASKSLYRGGWTEFIGQDLLEQTDRRSVPAGDAPVGARAA